MPITDYEFKERIFFAREVGEISGEDAKEWAQKLKEHADQSQTKIVALVDALQVKHLSFAAQEIFSKASFTPNVMAVIVATNLAVKSTSRDIGLLGKRNQTLVFNTVEEAREKAGQLLKKNTPQPTSS